MAALLPFHKAILEAVHDPSTSDLLILARGLGLRRIVCTLMSIYDSPQSLVLLVNASQEEEAAIGEELGIMGCRRPGLRIVGYEMARKERQELYKRGGLLSITSRILVVDMLQNDIPVDLITGMLVLHAERVSATSLEAFIVRLYREKNTEGFLKAFSDDPEHITSGLSPLKNVMKELHLRSVHIYPRFHEEVKGSLERRKADVIELFQPLTEAMSDIHGAIVQCMTTTLNELKRSNTSLDLDDLSVENAYFRSFDAVVRRQLDPVWHKVGPRTKQLVSDLSTLRRLLSYLLTYDPLAFHAYLETIIAANSTTHSGATRQNHSPWLLTDAANIIFTVAKRRCYTFSRPSGKGKEPVIDVDNEEAWEALDEIEGVGIGVKRNNGSTSGVGKKWLPEGMDPVLEELPKWNLLAEVLKEIEEEMIRQESSNRFTALTPGSNTVLVMASSTRTATLLSDFLSNMDPTAPPGQQGRKLLERKLKLYLWWKRKLAERKEDNRGAFAMPERNKDFSGSSQKDAAGEGQGISEALKRKDQQTRERQASRRRVRGGAPVAVVKSEREASVAPAQEARHGENSVLQEAEDVAEFFATQGGSDVFGGDLLTMDDRDVDGILQATLASEAFADDFDANYGLIVPAQTVLVRSYGDDADDRMLDEIRPRFIVMFEPNLDFVRRIEVYRSSNPGLAVRVYFLIYQLSSEEHKFLAAQRREKDAFERLIKERGSMLLPIFEDRRAVSGSEAAIKTISSRVAGGRREVNKEPSRVIVDMREFRSTLPSLLHASNLLVIPATLTVGDYILTPDICVERKSLPDLISSFNSGRLYTQCELMTAHYKQPILLIEFEEHKSFSLETVGDLKSYVRPTGKYAPKKKPGVDSSQSNALIQSVQSKLVLLTLTFPRVRIIWSSSPFATADIFNDLKLDMPEPDPSRAIAIGAEDDPDAGAGINAAAEELLRTLPGITAKNVKFVMSKVPSVRALCELDLAQVQSILGTEPGKACYQFMHHGERQRAKKT